MLLEKTFHAFKGSAFRQSGIDCGGNCIDKNDGICYMAGCIFPQYIGENSRLFHIFYWRIFQIRTVSADDYSEKAFHYAIPKDTFKKAAVITIMGISVIITGTYMMGIMEPGISFLDILFEVTSAFGTVGLSTGITPHLTDGSKILSVVIMYIGRLGPLTIATLWHFSKGERVSYPEGNLNIG